MAQEVTGKVIAGGLSFGGTKIAGAEVEEGHPAVVELLEAIACLQRHHDRRAVEHMERAMDLISEVSGLMAEF